MIIIGIIPTKTSADLTVLSDMVFIISAFLSDIVVEFKQHAHPGQTAPADMTAKGTCRVYSYI